MDEPSPPMPTNPSQAKSFAGLLFGFDTLIGDTLIKIVYYIGLALIALWVIFVILAGLAAMRYSAMTGLGMVLGAPIGGLIGVIFWRFASEMWIILFRIYFRLGEIRDRLK